MRFNQLLFVFLIIVSCHTSQITEGGYVSLETISVESNANQKRMIGAKYLIFNKQITECTNKFEINKDQSLNLICVPDTSYSIEEISCKFLLKELTSCKSLPDSNRYTNQTEMYRIGPSIKLDIRCSKIGFAKYFIDYIPESMLPFVLKMKELTHSEEFAYWQENAIPDSIYYKNINIKD